MVDLHALKMGHVRRSAMRSPWRSIVIGEGEPRLGLRRLPTTTLHYARFIHEQWQKCQPFSERRMHNRRA